ncbi:hypothetical protein [Moorena producens]|uniref:hypothetical protein n=1 Tax=Moorena producens TaxID=1155739 RepID=UPI003C73D7B6
MPVSCLFSVELASCQFHAYFRWNWHLASFMLIFGGTGILPVSCLFSVELASCQFHAYFPAGRMPTLLVFIPRLTQRLIFFPRD